VPAVKTLLIFLDFTMIPLVETKGEFQAGIALFGGAEVFNITYDSSWRCFPAK